MSLNVSLVESDTPGVSLYFDGQNVGDLQEAELQREEERQAKELRQLLETELEDFEDDFLSGSNSEDEGMASFDDSRDQRQEKYGPSPRMKAAASPSDNTHIKLQTILASFNKSDQGAQLQRQGRLHGGSEHHQTRHEALASATSLESSTNSGTTSDKFDAQPSCYPNVDMPRLIQIMETANQDHRHLNYLNMKTANHNDAESNHNHVLNGEGHCEANECNVSDLFLGLPNSNKKQNDASAAQNQPWVEHYSDGRYHHSSFANNFTATGLKQVPPSPGSESSRHNFVPTFTEQNVGASRAVNEAEMEDEWMMTMKNPQLTSFLHPDSHTDHSHPRFQHHHGQQQQWLVTDRGNNGLKNSPSTGVTSKAPASPHPESDPGTSTDILSTAQEPNRNLMLPSQSLRPANCVQSSSILPSSACSSSSVPPSIPATASRDDKNMQYTMRSKEILDAGDGQLMRYKVHYKKHEQDQIGEEQFYLDNEHVEYFLKDGAENQRTYEQLEILYRARGREIEEMTRLVKEKEEDRSKEIRSLKHKLALANGEAGVMEENLRQSQKLLQQAKSENTDSAGRVRALETQVTSLKEAKEELIKNHQVAESTIENMSHHIEELQNCDSLSRARNDHESIVSGLTSRYENELRAMNEKLAVCRSALEAKQEDLAQVKKQLAEITRELEQAQLSRGETINRLARSLEDSQRQCQALLEKSSFHEMSILKVQLQQAVASKRISEDLCSTFQGEVKELKEQLNMFESASNLGVFGLSSHATRASSHDDSMSDLGIRKTLNYDSPQSVAKYDGTQAADELVASLRTELERCLYSNKQKRSELADMAGEVKFLREEIEEARSRIADLEKACLEQKNQLEEVNSLGCPSDGVRVIEIRLRRDIDSLKREKEILMSDIEDYKKRLQEVGDSEAKLAEINAELSHQIAQMVNDFDVDKRTALESCQRTMEEVSRMSIDKLREEIEERFQSEKTMLTGQYKEKLHCLKQELSSAHLELDSVKSLYIKTCEESAGQEVELTDRFKKQLEEELSKMKDKLETEKREWECFMRASMEKEHDELRRTVESEFKEETEREAQAKVSQAKLACLEEQRLIRQAMVKEVKVEAKREQQQENQKELQLLSEERSSQELRLAQLSEEIRVLKSGQKLASEKNVSEKCREDFEHEFQTKLFLEKQHKEDLKELLEKYDRERVVVEERLNAMCLQLSLTVTESKRRVLGCDLSSEGSCLNENASFLAADVVGKISVLEAFLNEKIVRLKELEKMVDGGYASTGAQDTLNSRKKSLEMTVNERGGLTRVDNEDKNTLEENLRGGWLRSEDGTVGDSSLIGLGGCFRDNDEASPETLKSYVKKLEAMLNNMKQKYGRDVNELKQQHQKEFDKAARAREEKFQAELRYFLKEKEGQNKIKLEKAVKESEATAKLELDKDLRKMEEKYKLEMKKIIIECEEKVNVESQKVTEEFDEKMIKQMKVNNEGNYLRQKLEFEENMIIQKRVNTDGGDLKQKFEFEEMRDKMKDEMDALEEKYLPGKLSLEKKMERMEDERSNEIVELSLRHEEEERRLRVGFEREMDKMKSEHERIVGGLRQELEKGNSELERIVGSLRQELEKGNSEHERIVGGLRQELEKGNSEHERIVGGLRQELEKGNSEHERIVGGLRQELEKGNSEHERIVGGLRQELEKGNSEHERIVGGLRQELEKGNSEHERIVGGLRQELSLNKCELESTKRLLESLKGENEADRQIKEQLKKEIDKMKVSIRDAQGVTEEIQEARAKWFEEAQEYIRREIQGGVEDRLKVKQVWETNKEDFDKTVQERVQKEVEICKEKVEREKKEETRKKVEMEVENVKRKFVSELETRVVKEKSRLEEEVRVWREEAKKKMEEERNKVVRMLHSDSERILQEERKRIEEEMSGMKEKELREMRVEMEEEMRKRIQREREEWERDKEEYDNRVVEERNSEWRDRLQSEVEARTKACSERDKAVDFIKSRELIFREEKQKLTRGLKKCRDDLEEMKGEQMALEQKYTEMDRRYKTDMKEAKLIREQDLAKLKTKLEEEKEDLASAYKTQVTNLQDDFDAALERIRNESERDKAKLLGEVQKQTELISLPSQLPDSCSGSILELRDQYLDTVTKIKADVMTHVQNANKQAAATMKVEIHKQKLQVIEVFTSQVKAHNRSALSGQVSEKVIKALEHSIDLLSQHLVSTSGSASTTPRSSNTENIEGKPSSNDWGASNKQVGLQSCEKAYKKTYFSAEHKETTETFQPDTFLPVSDLARRNSDAIFELPVLDKGGRQNTSPERLSPRHHQHFQQNPKQRARSHPQLDNVDLFDADTFRRSPSSSNNSSPARHINVRSELKATAVKHHVAMPDVPSLSPNIPSRTRPVLPRTKPDFEDNAEVSGVHSPRDDMKFMEARVRLVNWVRNGEMPWKSSEKHRDADGFLKPGFEAEQWLMAQRATPYASSNKNQGHNNRYDHSYIHNPASSDKSDDDSSTGTNISFLTLESEAVENSGLKCLSLGANLGRHQSSQTETFVSGWDRDPLRSDDRKAVLEGTTKSKNFEYCHQDFHQKFGSQESVISHDSDLPPSHKPTQVYGKMALPTSTPLVKGNRILEEWKTQSEESSSSNSKQWKNIGGTRCFEQNRDVNKQQVTEHEQGNHWRPHFRSHSPQSNSVSRKSSRSRSAERNNENLVLKSAEFPSNLSRITQGSGSDQSHLWKYKSLEDLIPNLERPDREREVMKDVRLDARSERMMRHVPHDNTDKVEPETSQGRNIVQKQVDFVNTPANLHAPVKAMTSHFWEQQNVDNTEQQPGLNNPRQSGFSTFGSKVKNRTESEIRSVSKPYDKKNSPTRQKGKSTQSPDYKESFDTQAKRETGADWNTHVHSGSRSEPRPPRRQGYYMIQPSPELKIPDKHRNSDLRVDPKPQDKRSLHTHSATSSAIFMREVTDLRRSLEELQPHHYLQHSSPQKNVKNSRMTRSSSDQSLHTIHNDRCQSQGQGQNTDDPINTSQSHFDLRPFPHDEQF